jgi:hypothetical protein
MIPIVVLILIVLVAVTVISFALHLLFSPWLLLLAIGALLLIKFRPGRSHQ